MYVHDDSPAGVQRARIGKVKDLTKRFEALTMRGNWRDDGGRYSLPTTRPRAAPPHKIRVVCPACGEHINYFRVYENQEDKERN